MSLAFHCDICGSPFLSIEINQEMLWEVEGSWEASSPDLTSWGLCQLTWRRPNDFCGNSEDSWVGRNAFLKESKDKLLDNKPAVPSLEGISDSFQNLPLPPRVLSQLSLFLQAQFLMLSLGIQVNELFEQWQFQVLYLVLEVHRWIRPISVLKKLKISKKINVWTSN